MKRIMSFTLLFAIAGTMSAVNAGTPKETHPCYGVADCKTQTDRKDFSNCIKAHKEEANTIAACAEFRNDKKAYMEKHGIETLESLFN